MEERENGPAIPINSSKVEGGHVGGGGGVGAHGGGDVGVAKGEGAAVGVVDDGDLLDAEDDVADDEVAEDFFDVAAGVADDEGV